MPTKEYKISLSDKYSGNVTLDKLLRKSGFTLPHDETCGLVVLLRGKPGTGKSTLALQILDGLELRKKKGKKRKSRRKQESGKIPPLTKYYCSVEQTVTDLHFKRLSMLVAQAILAAWEPSYSDTNADNSKLICNPNTFKARLPASLNREITRSKGLKESIGNIIKRLSIPLYKGPSDEHHILPAEARSIAESILKQQASRYHQEAEKQIKAYLKKKVKPDTGEGRRSGKASFSIFAQRKQQILLDSRPVKGEKPRQQARRKTNAIERLAHLLFEHGIAHDGHDLCFRGLEDDAGVISADEPFGAERSRSLGALRMLDAIVAELQSNRPAGDRDRARRPVVVIDGLSLLANSEREMLEIQGIVDRLRQLSQVGIVVYEPNEDESVNLDHHADMVIELQRKELKDPMAYLIHEICLKKARYQETALGQHQFKIRRSGLVFFPSVHLHIQHASYMDFEVIRSTPKEYKPVADPERWGRALGDERSIVDMIFPPRSGEMGESIMLLGSRGTFKTELTLDFLSRGSIGCPKGKEPNELEQGLLVSLIDNSPNIERGLWCPWRKARYDIADCIKCRGLLSHARPFKQPPGCISSAEFLYYLEEVIGRLQPEDDNAPRLSRLVFWDLTQLDHRFPLLKADNLLLPALIDVFKQKGLHSLFMGAENATHTSAASAMADNVLFCWRSHTFEKGKAWEKGGKAWSTKTGRWKLQEMLMLYVDRAAAPERPGTILYNIPIYSSENSERLQLPETAKKMNASPYLTDWREASQEDQAHITRLRRLQGLE
jgi:KaiC/GvpD/RAD55 family RecA-like ATPase